MLLKDIITGLFLRILLSNRVLGKLSMALLNQHVVAYGPSERLHLDKTATVHNALFNVASGNVYIGENVFFGTNVSVLTGKHDYSKFGPERISSYPGSGNDIHIEEGAWVASDATILGPCRIGKHAVVAAGSLVKNDVPAYTVVAGIPARVVSEIKH